MSISLNTIIIFTDRLEELADFYTRVFNFGPWARAPNHLGCQLGSVYFGFDRIKKCEQRSNCGIMLWFEVDDINESYTKLIRNGAVNRYPPVKKPWGDILASVFDPDENIIGIVQKKSSENPTPERNKEII